MLNNKPDVLSGLTGMQKMRATASFFSKNPLLRH